MSTQTCIARECMNWMIDGTITYALAEAAQTAMVLRTFMMIDHNCIIRWDYIWGIRRPLIGRRKKSGLEELNEWELNE